jgi:hypothetical protein
MARILFDRIKTVELVKSASVHYPENLQKALACLYTEKGYSAAPKSSAEAKAAGVKTFNGGVVALVDLRSVGVDGGDVIFGDLVESRYLAGQAMRDYVEANPGMIEDDLLRLSPKHLHVSLIAPVKVGGEYFLLSQIKGDALGEGQIHTGLIAGMVDAKYYGHDNPLVAALRQETSEELGLNLDDLGATSAVFLMDESELGYLNFAHVARRVSMDSVLESYDASVRDKLGGDEKLEVNGVSLLPVAGVALVPLEGAHGVRAVKCYTPSESGLVSVVEDREVRPYTAATIEYLQKPGNINFLLEKAGF